MRAGSGGETGTDAGPAHSRHPADGAHARPAHEPPPAVLHPTSPHPPRHRAGVRGVGPGAAWSAAATLLLVLVAARVLRTPVHRGEGLLAADAYLLATGSGLPAGPLSPGSAGTLHIAGYAALTRAFDRDASLVLAGREVFVAATLLAAVLLWWAGRRLGLTSGASAAALLFGIPLLLLVGAGLDIPSILAALWLAAAGCLLLVQRRTVLARAAAAVLAVPAVLLAPDAGLLVLAAGGVFAASRGGAAGWRRWAPAAACGAGFLVVAVLLRLAGAGTGLPASPGPRTVLLLAGALSVLAGAAAALQLPALRGPGLVLVATAAAGLVPPVRLAALVVCLPLAAVLAAAVAEDSVTRRAGRVPRRVLTGGAAAVLVAAAVAVVVVPDGGSPPGKHPQVALLGWARDQLPTPIRLVAGRLPAAELRHAGAPSRRVLLPAHGRPADLRVAEGGAGAAPGRVVARFSGNGGTLEVRDPAPGSPNPAELARRRSLTAALLANPTTQAPGPVRAVLRSASVDPRLVSVLAALASESGVGIATLPAVPGELAAVPVRRALVSSVGGMPLRRGSADTQDVVLWLRAQLPPYAPDTIAVTDDGVLVGYRYASAPDTLITRSTP